MSGRRLLLGGAGVVVLGVIAAIAVAVWVLASGGTGEASAPISAPQLTVAPAAVAPAAVAAVASTRTAAAAAPAPTSPPTAAPTASREASRTAAAPSPTPTRPPTSAAADPPATSPATQRIYRIVPEQSEVRYQVDEILRGQPNTVVGRTDQVAGDIRLDFGTPANSEIGTIRINVRTLRTDEGRRDRATRGRILQSAQDAFEFAELVPTRLEGLPSSIELRVPVDVQIIGDLTIRDVTRPVTFAATVTLVADDRLEGSAVATIQRGDYDLVIPSIPFVAGVSEAVRLEIDFVAVVADGG